ncbi:MAG: hypothetical protein GIKADHBN_02320 [Phycisphaerales bacterium]|nr:hypothetical protein [Phycisphaerales bacterium]
MSRDACTRSPHATVPTTTAAAVTASDDHTYSLRCDPPCRVVSDTSDLDGSIASWGFTTSSRSSSTSATRRSVAPTGSASTITSTEAPGHPAAIARPNAPASIDPPAFSCESSGESTTTRSGAAATCEDHASQSAARRPATSVVSRGTSPAGSPSAERRMARRMAPPARILPPRDQHHSSRPCGSMAITATGPATLSATTRSPSSGTVCDAAEGSHASPSACQMVQENPHSMPERSILSSSTRAIPSLTAITPARRRPSSAGSSCGGHARAWMVESLGPGAKNSKTPPAESDPDSSPRPSPNPPACWRTTASTSVGSALGTVAHEHAAPDASSTSIETFAGAGTRAASHFTARSSTVSSPSSPDPAGQDSAARRVTRRRFASFEPRSVRSM